MPGRNGTGSSGQGRETGRDIDGCSVDEQAMTGNDVRGLGSGSGRGGRPRGGRKGRCSGGGRGRGRRQ